MDVRRMRFLAGSLSVLAIASARAVQAQAPLANVRVGATANDAYAQVYFAQDAGFFTKAGLNVDVETLNNGAAVSAAVAGGALDIGVSTPVQLANALARGIPFVLVAAGGLETPQAPSGMVCVAKSGPLRTAKDLEGKIVAVNALKTLFEAAFDLWMTQNGADPDNVRVVEIGFPAMDEALQRGTVAAAVISEPALSIALKTGNVRALGDPDAAIAARFLVSGWFAMTQFVQTNRDVVKRFQTAIAEAGRWANGHHDESAAILAKYSKMDVDVIRAMGRCPFTDQLRLSDIQPQLNVAFKFGIIPKPVNAADMLPH